MLIKVPTGNAAATLQKSTVGFVERLVRFASRQAPLLQRSGLTTQSHKRSGVPISASTAIAFVSNSPERLWQKLSKRPEMPMSAQDRLPAATGDLSNETNFSAIKYSAERAHQLTSIAPKLLRFSEDEAGKSPEATWDRYTIKKIVEQAYRDRTNGVATPQTGEITHARD